MAAVSPDVVLAGTDRDSFAKRWVASGVFKMALLVNSLLTILCLVSYATGFGAEVIGAFSIDVAGLAKVGMGILIFNLAWGLVWYAVKNLLLRYAVHMIAEDRRAAFSSRMSGSFELRTLLERYSERRIRIVDMIGRRGRFITIGLAAFFYLYAEIHANRPADFAAAFLSNTLLDGVVASWLLLALYYRDGFVAAALFGPQSRIMDGTLARANCLTIATLWTLFKFVFVPIGTQLAALFSPEHFAVVFALIWGSYMVTDTLAEVGGSIYGRHAIRVLGIGEINRKSVAGTLTGFIGGLVFCVSVVALNELTWKWYALAAIVACSNTVLELISPRGTDDFTMTTGNALLCWGFGLACV